MIECMPEEYRDEFWSGTTQGIVDITLQLSTKHQCWYAIEADRQRWQQLGPNPPREPTIFEAWDGDERSLTVRHYVGNGVCAYFEGFSAYRAGAGVYTVLIGT